MKKYIYLSCFSAVLALFTATKAMALPVNPPPTQETFIKQVRCGAYAAFLASEANISHYESRMYRHIEQATVTSLILNPEISDAEALVSSTSEVARQLGWEQASAYHSGDREKYQREVMDQYIDKCNAV